MKKFDVSEYHGGDMRLEGITVFQGRITLIGWESGDILDISLKPFAEQSANKKQWILSAKTYWDLRLSIIARKFGDRIVILKTAEGETVTLFQKGHGSTLDYATLVAHT